jgi:hypothetical protein
LRLKRFKALSTFSPSFTGITIIFFKLNYLFFPKTERKFSNDSIIFKFISEKLI